MNRLGRTTRNFRKTFPISESRPQIGMPVQWPRRWLAIFAEKGPKSAAECRRFELSGSKSFPDGIEILSNLRFLVPNLRLRILQELGIVKIAAFAAANPEMIWQN